jgi:SSS family solute:Na+ symporter
MAIAADLKPTYPVHIGGFTFPGYTALYTVILNVVVAMVLTVVFKALGAQRPAADETAAADYIVA